jgi:Phage protein Gp138 N-terminal domain/GpV Apex motif
MSDTRDTRNAQRDAQAAPTIEAAHAAQMEGRLKLLHTCLPGIIVSYDATKQTAQVQPAIQRIFTERGAVNLPICADVPVAFIGGGGFFLTFPVAAGDECLLWFSERSIDLWHALGGVQPPAEYRLHDLSDGFAIVGLNSQPHVLASFNTADAELRNRARTARVTMKADGSIEVVNGSGSYILAASGNLTVTSPTVTINGDVNVVGTLTASVNVIGGGKSLKTHIHSGVTAGLGNTGAPV